MLFNKLTIHYCHSKTYRLRIFWGMTSLKTSWPKKKKKNLIKIYLYNAYQADLSIVFESS